MKKIHITLKKILLLLLSCVCFSSVWAENENPIIPEQDSSVQKKNPKVALVLAGGGAKGLAHIGVIKVLEEAGLPIDIVVGNSMGSIVGGLYAIGYDANQLDSLTRATDWSDLLLDSPNYGNKLLTSKKMNETYQLRVSLDPQRRIRQGGLTGLIDGMNIESMLTHLTEGVDDNVDFNTLPRPFACNATDVKTGSIYEFHNGDIAMAMRASMAIPGVFTPIHKDSLMLVDGFVTNNYPVDVARRMGADIIVGVDLVSHSQEAVNYDNFTNLMTHLLELSSSNLYDKNIKDTQIYIDVDVTGFASSSFGKEEIDTLIKRGEARARQLLPLIVQLRDSLLNDGHSPYNHIVYTAPKKSDTDDDQNNAFRKTFRTSSINLGARFDNDEYASLHVNPQFMLPTKKKDMMVQLYARLGLRLKGEMSFDKFTEKNSRFGFSYFFEHGEFQFYNYGERAAVITSYHQCPRFYFSQEWNKVQYTFGLRFDWYKYTDILVDQGLPSPRTDKNDHFFTLYAQAEYNSLNSEIFPLKGTLFKCSASLVTRNLIYYINDRPLPMFQMNWKTVIPIGTPRFTIAPHVRGRALLTGVDDSPAPFALLNTIGGLKSGMKMDQQIVAAGMANVELIADNGILFGGIDLQQRIGDNHYIQASIDGGTIADRVREAVMKDHLTWGAQLGYSYDTGAGPLSLTGYWSERTRRVAFMFNFGYYF